MSVAQNSFDLANRLVQDNQSRNSFDQRLPLPERWAGLRDREFSQAAGIADGVFCHPSRFICAATSRASAIALAQRSIEAARR